MAFTVVNVIGTFLRSDGTTPDQGEVVFTLSDPLVDTTNNEIVAPDSHVAPMDAAGSISINLVATDDATTLPQGAVYHVVEHHSFGRSVLYDIDLPGAVSPLDIADAAPVTAVVRRFTVSGGTP